MGHGSYDAPTVGTKPRKPKTEGTAASGFREKGLSAQSVIVAKQLSRLSSVLAAPLNVVGVVDGDAANVRTTVNDPLGRVLMTPEKTRAPFRCSDAAQLLLAGVGFSVSWFSTTRKATFTIVLSVLTVKEDVLAPLHWPFWTMVLTPIDGVAPETGAIALLATAAEPSASAPAASVAIPMRRFRMIPFPKTT
jgi:hypothetical protein